MFATKVNIEDIKNVEADNSKRHFWTTFEHLNAHYGIRRGVLSGYMGSMGAGKSSLMKTIAMQAAVTSDKIKVLYYLSEEKTENYCVNMLKYDAMSGGLERIEFIREPDMEHDEMRTHDQFLEHFKRIVSNSFCDIVFIDNITTSRLYSNTTGFNGQTKTTEFLKVLAQDLNIAIVYMAHTQSNVSDNMGRLITSEDIRGSKDIAIQTSYLYALQKFTSNGRYYLTLRTLKHRDHVKGGGCYILEYNNEMGVYVGDQKVEFEAINEIFKSRDQLGKK